MDAYYIHSYLQTIRPITFVPGLYKIFDEIMVNAADNKQRDPSMDTIKVEMYASILLISAVSIRVMVVSRLKSALTEQTKSLFGTMETEYLLSCTRSTMFMCRSSFLATYLLVHGRKNYKMNGNQHCDAYLHFFQVPISTTTKKRRLGAVMVTVQS